MIVHEKNLYGFGRVHMVMIWRKSHGSWENKYRMENESVDGPEVIRWAAGCAVAIATMIGVGILVFLVALALQPPVWLQIALGALLAVGAAIFGWLVATAWRRPGTPGGRT